MAIDLTSTTLNALVHLAYETAGRVSLQLDDGTRFVIADTPYVHDGEVVVPIAEEE